MISPALRIVNPVPAPEWDRVIHDDIINYVDDAIHKIYDMWKKRKCVPPFFLSWPRVTVSDYEGKKVNDVCTLDLPEDRSRWTDLMVQAVQLTKSFAILLVEQREEDILLILESGHGTRSWSLPIERRGDVTMLGKPVKKTDADRIGLLWPAAGTS
jgi:hypothetical protein